MPYLTGFRKDEMRKGDYSKVAGDLNYALTTVIIQYLVRKKLRYQTLNDIVAALLLATDEFQERVRQPLQFFPGIVQDAIYTVLFAFIEIWKKKELLYRRWEEPETPHELRHVFTMLIYRYLADNGVSDQTVCDVRGALDLANKEFCRRIVYPYEDRAIIKNGDVYPESLLSQVRPISESTRDSQ